jgi:hypothetical protein
MGNIESIDEQYKTWLDKQQFETIDKNEMKKTVIKELEFLHVMSAEEYTLYRKWQEINNKYPLARMVPKDTLGFFFGGKFISTEYPEVQAVKDNMWMPESPDDYLNLEPVVRQTDKKTVKIWNILRTFTSTMLNNPNIGRNLRFIIEDGVTGKYLGVICISSDFLDLTPRDNWIGWTREIRTQKKMIGHTAIGSTIVPVQPLGFSYVGGKLLALLTVCDVTEKAWNDRYKQTLAGYTTTSLYGGYSQYTGLKYWKKMGMSAGSIRFEPSKDTVMMMRKWLMRKEPRKYFEWYHAKNPQGLPYKRDHKQRSLSYIYRQMKIPKNLIETNHQRGIYFCKLYENTQEFLRMETQDLGKRMVPTHASDLTQLWKAKYAKKRVASLLKNDRYSLETLFYDDLIGDEWENTKERYISQVGR